MAHIFKLVFSSYRKIFFERIKQKCIYSIKYCSTLYKRIDIEKKIYPMVSSFVLTRLSGENKAEIIWNDLNATTKKRVENMIFLEKPENILANSLQWISCVFASKISFVDKSHT